MDFHGLDDAVRVDDEGAAQGQSFCVDVNAEGACQLVCRVADQREPGLAHSRGGFVPHLVREVRVGCDDIHLSAGLLELGIVVGSVFHFGRAVEGESGRHENQNRPLALERVIGHLNEFAVVEGLGLERLDLCIDQRHGVSFSEW